MHFITLTTIIAPATLIMAAAPCKMEYVERSQHQPFLSSY